MDVIAEKSDTVLGAIRTLWQAKKYGVANKVKLNEVRELSAIRDDDRATKAVIITTSHLPRDAIEWVKRDKFRLDYRDKERIENWIKLRVFGQ
jgi:restriction endonuclease Mrr